MPIDSALFYNESGGSSAGATRLNQFHNYDHDDLHNGLPDGILFGQIKADLNSIPPIQPSNPAPRLTQITPASVVGSGNALQDFTLTGLNFEVASIVKVISSTYQADSRSFGLFHDSTTQLRFRIPTGTLRDTWSVQVINSDGQVSNPLTFQVTAPVVANTYSLNATATYGTITRSPNLDRYPANSQVTLTAAPIPGYVFSVWSGDANGYATTLSITMDRNKSIVAVFVPVTASGATITSVDVDANSGCKNTPTAQWVNIHGSGFSAGAYVILGANGWTAPASPGVTDLSGIPTLVRVCMILTQATQWTAQVVNAGQIYSNVWPFSTAGAAQFTVTTSASPANFGETSGGGPYAEGTNVTVVASPYTGYVLDKWTENGNYVSSERGFSFPIHSSRNLVANFVAAIGPTLTGSITVNIVPAGAVTAGAGWRLSGETQWRNSGARALNLPLGSYTVEFNQLPAWNPPSSQTVQIAVNNPDISVTSGNYVQPQINAPSNLQAVQNSDGSVRVTWTDNSSNEIAFELQQKLLGGGYLGFPWQAPNSTSYVTSSKYAGYFGPVCFRIRAVGGTGAIFSVFSDEVCATPHPFTVDAACYAPVSDGGLGQAIDRIAAGFQQVIALRGDGTVWRWGQDPFSSDSGQSPVQIPGLADITRVSMSYYHALALRKDGTVWAWGVNANGEIGDGTYTDRPTPVRVPGLSGIVAVAARGSHSMALKSDGTVWAWGYNVSGALGDGTTNDHAMPIQVPNLTGVTQIAAGEGASFAIGVGGILLAWGGNDEGTLGIANAQNIAQLTPVPVPGIGSVTAVSARDSYALAIQQDGTVWAWGKNASGRIGDGSPNSVHTTPFQVPGVQNIVAVSTAVFGSHAVDSSGNVWGWGASSDGSIGDGTVAQQGIGPNGTVVQLVHGPSLAIALTDVVAVTSAYYTTGIAVRANGTVCTWGGNGQGQLGDGSTYNARPVPGHVVGPGGVGAFNIVDATPDQFVFNSQTGTALNSSLISNSITVTGIESSAPISVTGGEYSINGGAFTNAEGVVRNGDTVAVRVTSSGNGAVQTCATLTIRGVSGPFCATTAALPDLVVTALSVPSTGTIGGQIALSANVTNQGTASAGPYRLGFYRSTDATITTGDTPIAACNMAALAPGTVSPACAGTVTIPSSLSPGIYYIGAIADDLGAIGESDESNNVAFAPITLGTLPGPPTIGTATAGIASINVNFGPPASNGGAAITGYAAICTSSNGGVPGSNTVGASATSIRVNGLTNGKRYTCTVTASNSVGPGPASAPSNAVTPFDITPILMLLLD